MEAEEEAAAYMPADAAPSPQDSSGSRYEFRSPPSILSSEAATPAASKEGFEKLLSEALTPDADGQQMSLEQHDEILALMDQIQQLEMGEKRSWGPQLICTMHALLKSGPVEICGKASA